MHMFYVGCCSLYVGCCRHRVGCYILCACCAGTMWAVAFSVWTAAASLHDVQALRGLFHPPCGLQQAPRSVLQPLRAMRRHCVGFHSLYVDYHILHARCTGTVWAVAASVWSNTGSVWLLRPARMVRRRRAGRCILCVGFHIFCVGCYSLHVCCAGTVRADSSFDPNPSHSEGAT